MLRKKQKNTPISIEHRINFVNAEAINIKKSGSYILQIDNYMSGEQLNEILKTLKKETGAKWIAIQGQSIKVVNNGI